jgi:ribosomal protein S18 acetylase RimI-like enzyme
MEPLTLDVGIALRDSAEELAVLAARTFPLACPPSTPAEDIASFIDTNLSAMRFVEYLADPQRTVLIARHDGRIVGYAMLIRGADGDAELSKIYLLAEFHGTGPATVLMDAALKAAADRGAHSVWLGVNQENQRAQGFYLKSGFKINGTRTFRVGARQENDYVMIRELP